MEPTVTATGLEMPCCVALEKLQFEKASTSGILYTLCSPDQVKVIVSPAATVSAWSSKAPLNPFVQRKAWFAAEAASKPTSRRGSP